MDEDPEDFSRGGSLALGMYYVNGPMIIGYDMDPLGLIPSYLIHEEIWFRCIGWYGYVPTDSYDEPALPIRAPNVESRRPLLAVPPHRSAVFVAGELRVNSDSLQLTGPPSLWEKDSKLTLATPRRDRKGRLRMKRMALAARWANMMSLPVAAVTKVTGALFLECNAACRRRSR